MATVRIPDDGGDGANFLEYEGLVLPNGDVNAIRNIRNVTVRGSDIIVAAYPKAGTHWVTEILHLILSHSLDGNEYSKMQTMMESTPENEYKDLPSPRVLNTHLFLDQLPADVIRKKARVVYLVRNPRDVAVSYYNFLRVLTFCEYTGKWENFYRPFYKGKFCYGSWFDHTLHWEEVKRTRPDLPVLLLHYEDIKLHAVQEVTRLCDFLELDRDSEFIQRVCNKCEFNTLKERKAETECASYAFRKGEVGDWKNWFTVAQNEWFDQLYQEKMKDCPITFKYTLE